MKKWMSTISDMNCDEHDPGQALSEPTPEVAAVCTMLGEARTNGDRKRAQAALKSVMGREPPLTAADKAGICVAIAKAYFRLDRRSVQMFLTMAAERARKSGALRASMHALREAQAIEFDPDRERLIDETTSDLVTGRYLTSPTPDATTLPKESSTGRPMSALSSPAPSPKRVRGRKRKNKSAAMPAKKKKKTASPASSAPNDRPLLIAREFDHLTSNDLSRVAVCSTAAHVTIFSSRASAFIGVVEITHGQRGDRAWRCPRCHARAEALHLTNAGRLECAACKTHVTASWRSFGPEVIALIERVSHGERIPPGEIVDAVARHMEQATP